MTPATFLRRAIAPLGFVVLAPAGRGQTVTPVPAPSDSTTGRPLSIDEALRMAEGQSEALRVARAGVERASGDQYRARSAFLPQLYGSASYARTLRSQFQGLSVGGPPPDSTIPKPIQGTGTDTTTSCFNYRNPGGSQAQQIAGLDSALRCFGAYGSGGGIDFSSAGFGALNQWTFGLSFSQTLFAGGRNIAQVRAASASRRSANIELTAQRAQLALDVTQAYYDAVLSDRLVAIAESALTQTQSVLRQTQVARNVGNTSEFELLRAQVTRDNQVPQVIQRRGTRDVAYLRLRQLLHLPLDEPVRLTTDIEDTAVAPGVRLVARTTPAEPDTSAERRASVRQASETVRAQRELLRVARAEYFPSISLTSGYQRLFFPLTTLPDLNQYRENWTVGVSASFPIFAGGRIRGDQRVAQANLAEARARLDQTREFAALDARVALNALRQAESAWAASQGTAQQAARAYSIAEVRYSEGLSTQVELSDSRILLQQAQANRAVAARDLQLARVRLQLLRDLPLSATGSAQQQGTAATGGQGTQPQSQQPQQPSQPQGQAAPQSASASVQTGQIGSATP